MEDTQLTFQHKKFILKILWKYENKAEVKRRFTRECHRNAPLRVTISCILDNFKEHGSIQCKRKRHSGRNRSSTSPTGEQELIDNVQNSPKKSIRQIARETGIPKFSVHRILKQALRKSFNPALVRALKDDTD